MGNVKSIRKCTSTSSFRKSNFLVLVIDESRYLYPTRGRDELFLIYRSGDSRVKMINIRRGITIINSPKSNST
ncbi:hypothetical protein CEXT_665671 [Caerostris extrusa]|uniref:Uncharacterized protein n=1 Tax=Caerostris extrusa TaxID=172846 RepID=A0AAV4Y0Q0_CAEEX|nr:hypothetical protein CEXT_665671 [Caerostris extrusa]